LLETAVVGFEPGIQISLPQLVTRRQANIVPLSYSATPAAKLKIVVLFQKKTTAAQRDWGCLWTQLGKLKQLLLCRSSTPWSQ